MPIEQISMEQTGVVVIKLKDGSMKACPTFTTDLFAEGRQLETYLKGEIVIVLATNDFFNNVVTDELKEVLSKDGYLSELLMEDLRSGIAMSYSPVLGGDSIAMAKTYYA